MHRLYNSAMRMLWLPMVLWSSWQSRDPEHRHAWSERFARRLPSAPRHGVWIHGSSVGEARIVSSLASGLRACRSGMAVVVSAFTRTGRAQLPGAPAVDAAFLMPLDFPGYPSRLFAALQPSILTLVETELWPNLISEAAAADVPVVVVNARLSPQRMTKYRRYAGLYRPVLRTLTRVGAQSEQDAERLLELGLPASAVEITGNIKYDLPLADVDTAELRRQSGIPAARPVLVAGSTGQGEEQQVLAAFARARRENKDLFLVLAPRHPPRIPEVEDLLGEAGLRFARLSDGPGALEAGIDLLLVDTVGQLSKLYRLATIAFVGGSLVPVGGHNLLEPAAAGVPVVYGPHTHHVEEIASTLEQAGGALRVRNADELADTLVALLRDAGRRTRIGQAAEQVVLTNRGALGRSVALILEARRQ
jgi:3-deoxy-D-manno-octulosonic-acid transferase